MADASSQAGDILLVEDNRGDARLVEEAAKDAERIETIHVVANGDETLDFALQRGQYADAPYPSIILLDWDLPKTLGKEVLAEIQATAEINQIPVIVLTGSQSPRDVETAYELQANAVIQKPATADGYSEFITLIDEFWLQQVTLPVIDGSERDFIE